MKIERALTKKQFNQVYSKLSHLNQHYPNFTNWYHNTATKTHSIYIIKDDDIIISVLILKNNDITKKISTLWVAPSHRRLGVATKFITFSCEVLNVVYPEMSIHKNLIDEYRAILKKFDFKITSYSNNQYYIN